MVQSTQLSVDALLFVRQLCGQIRAARNESVQSRHVRLRQIQILDDLPAAIAHEMAIGRERAGNGNLTYFSTPCAGNSAS